MTYEITDHPADVGFRARGPTLAVAFAEAVAAVGDIVGGGPVADRADGADGPDGTVETRAVDVEARDHEALLFDLLGEVILFGDVADVRVTRASDVAIEPIRAGEGDAGEGGDGAVASEGDEADGVTGYRLTATLHGRPIPPDAPLLDLKAPTYGGMRVVEDEDGWTVEAVIDV